MPQASRSCCSARRSCSVVVSSRPFERRAGLEQHQRWRSYKGWLLLINQPTHRDVIGDEL